MVDDVRAGLESDVETRERAAELKEEIERTDEGIGIVKEAVGE